MKFKEYKGLDLPQLAADVLGQWDADDTFHKSISTREGHPTFVFYEGPPSANGLPGIHHVMARTIKDIICRYKTQQGFLVHRKAGWDTHGLPVELGVEKKLGITKEDIGRKISIEEYNRTCRSAVMEFTGVWENLTRRILDVGADGKRRIRRQSPRRGRPGQKIEIARNVLEEGFAPLVAHHAELCRAGRILHVAVASRLVQLVRRKARSGRRRIGLDGIALI